MRLKEVVERLEKDSEFKSWKEKNKKSYLAHVFQMMDKPEEFQIGYYNHDNTVTTFVLEEDDITIHPNQEIFQKEKKKVGKLHFKKVKFDVEKALEIAKEFQQKELEGNDPAKIMIVLQNIANHTIYNVTYITGNFNTLNIKIDADDEKIVSHELTPMLQFRGKNN